MDLKLDRLPRLFRARFGREELGGSCFGLETPGV